MGVWIDGWMGGRMDGVFSPTIFCGVFFFNDDASDQTPSLHFTALRFTSLHLIEATEELRELPSSTPRGADFSPLDPQNAVKYKVFGCPNGLRRTETV